MAGESPLSFGATVSLSATSSTGRATLPALNSNQLVITNLGPDLAYVALGSATVVATSTTGYPMMPGSQITVTINPTIVAGAAICATTTATILFTAADGALHGLAAASTSASGGATESVNLAQVAGTTTATGHGVSGAGVQRVELPSDGTGVVGLNAGTAVIGHVIADTGSTTAVTGNVTVVQPTGTSLHAVLDTTSTTAVTQATGTNLHTVVDSGTINAVTAITNALPAGTNFVGYSTPRVATLTTSITRPSDTNAYAANDAFANSTSAPTTGGFTLTSAAAASGGYGTITDAVFSMSASSAFQGELWIFDQAVTATNDNAALSVSDGDILNLVGVIPFNTTDVDAVNAISYVTGLNIGFTCVGTANLRFLVKVISAFTPASAEVLSVRVKVQN